MMIDENYISDRIATLRTAKNISARDMSLSLGQSQSYINNIENGKSLPSMQMFLYICEFLEVTPKDFFDENIVAPNAFSESMDAFKPLNRNQLNLLIALSKEMK
ncbi:MAG: helix-turn-helix domain-containing protein [Ruminiclostridium sp.]